MNWTELKDILQMGGNPIAVGDEFAIELKTGERVTLVCELAESNHTTFFTKNLLADTHSMDEGWITDYTRHLSDINGYLERLFRLLPDDLQNVICDKKLRLLREKEVFGKNWYGEPEDCEQFPRYRNQENRVKCLDGVPFPYWLASPYTGCSGYFCNVDSHGRPDYRIKHSSYGVCFGFDV